MISKVNNWLVLKLKARVCIGEYSLQKEKEEIFGKI